MDRLHARYPFLGKAREAVERAEVDLAALVEGGDSAVVGRAVERVETAIAEGTVGQPRRPRVELLSYPVARVVVSLVDDDDLTRAYAAAEARTARERFVADVEEPAPESVAGSRIDLARLLAEFDLADAGARDDDRFGVDVGPYLRLATGLNDPDWRLVRRDLVDGTVPVDREELYALLEAAVRERVADGLPLSVPDAVAAPLGDDVERIERALAETSPPQGVDTVAPELFPPCVRALVERARDGEELPPHSAFSLVSFLTGIGLDAEGVARLCDRDPETFDHRVSRLAGENGTDYPAPSCATMDAYGDCVDKDDLCGRVDHPMSYYARRVEAADPADGAEN
jgi:DNA primase large subunit